MTREEESIASAQIALMQWDEGMMWAQPSASFWRDHLRAVLAAYRTIRSSTLHKPGTGDDE